MLHLSAAPSLPLAIDAGFRGEQSMVSFTVTPLTDHTGAEVLGLDTNGDLGAPSLRPIVNAAQAPA